jgi:MoxR-like ATPase
MNSIEKDVRVNPVVLDQVITQISQVLLGKQVQVKLALACILAGGHLLIEDLPGMGKTTLAHALADVMGLSYNRVQFTSDLLPADLLGISIFDRQDQRFEFHQGPIFTQLLLADEINRTTPKTQSALLEAMEERQVSIEGITRELPQPFFVIATQNPSNHSGTYELPESQLDRFLMRIQLGFPCPAAERKMLQSLGDAKHFQQRANSTVKRLQSILCQTQLENLQRQVRAINVSDNTLDYVQRLIQYSRESSAIEFGVSPRGSMALLSAAKAWALLESRDYLLPEDVQQVFAAVVGHRVSAVSNISHSDKTADALANFILSQVDVIYA